MAAGGRSDPPRDVPDESRAADSRAAFLQAIPAALQHREDNIPKLVAADNSSSRSKLRKIYRIADEMLQHAASHVACHDGCASCCKMNVQITGEEAAAIERATGRLARTIASSMPHASGEYNGIPCPFLVDERCSIYEHRPLACRMHVSFYSNAYWCHPERNLSHPAPMVKFEGLTEALSKIGARQKFFFADIRDFFC